MKKFLLLAAYATAACLLVPSALQAQQTKRNLVPNGDFEKGVGNWMIGASDTNPIEVYGDEDTPISGTQSLMVYVPEKKTYPWDQSVRIFMGVQKHAKYKVSFKIRGDQTATQMGVEMNMNVDGNKALDLDVQRMPAGFVPEITEAPELRGTIEVTQEAHEYIFYTTGTQDGHFDYQFSFRFGVAEVGTYWIDDVKICRADDQDWDGNLFPIGDFESQVPNITVSNNDAIQEYAFSNTRNDLSTVEIAASSPLNTGKAFHILKNKDDNSTYWGCGLFFLVYLGEDVLPEVSFKLKGAREFDLLSFRSNAKPWNANLTEGAGDMNGEEIHVTGEAQHIVARPNTLTSGKYRSNPYYPCQMFAWLVLHGEMKGYDRELWIDDIVVKDAGLKLEDFEVLNVPENLNVGATQQLKIGEFVQPNNAPATVVFSVEDGTGKATIDQNGMLTGVQEGTVTVKVSTPDNSVVKTFTVTIKGGSSLKEMEISSNTYIYPTLVKSNATVTIVSPAVVSEVAVFAANGSLVKKVQNTQQFATGGFTAGVYYVKILVDGEIVTKKMIVK